MSESLGQILKGARAQKGLSIEQLSQLTHIKIRFLEAMENDQFESIPSAVQLKGFIRMYADQVGLPAQQLIDILSGKEPVPAPAAAESGSADIKPAVKAPGPKKENKSRTIFSRGASLLPLRKNEPAGAIDDEAAAPIQAESTTIFKEIGQTIRGRREALGLNLPDIEEYIHVRAYYLKLIEEGNIQDLPSLVQARGMLNNYLNFLDLNADDLMLRFADGLQQIHFEKTGSVEPPKKAKRKPVGISSGWRRFLTTDLILGTVVILLIVGLAIWGVFQVSALPDNSSKPGSGSISDVLIQTLPAVTGTVSSNPSKPGPGDNLSSGQGTESAPAEPTSTQVFTGGGPVQLYIVSNQRAYLRVIVDGKKVFDGRTLPGNAYPFSGNQAIELLAGNAAAFKVSYLLNGTSNDMGALGSNGEVKDYIFTNQGIVTPTPKFTGTATAAPLPSTTPEFTSTPEEATITPFIPQN